QVADLRRLDVQRGLDPGPDLLVGGQQRLLRPPEVHERVPVVEQDPPDGDTGSHGARKYRAAPARLSQHGRRARLTAVRVTVISDLHGAADRLRQAAAECDVLVVLGDLINVLDYHDMDGILVDM